MISVKMASSGFTLIELLVAIAVAAILLTLAVPNFVPWVASNRLTSQANELVADISLARSESATREKRITICASSDGSSCNGTDWAVGRIVFVDTNGDGQRQTAETLLKVTQALSGNTTVALSGFPNNGYIQFRTFGGLNPSVSGAFTLCSVSIPAGAQGRQGRRINVAVTGRPSASRIQNCP